MYDNIKINNDNVMTQINKFGTKIEILAKCNKLKIQYWIIMKYIMIYLGYFGNTINNNNNNRFIEH